MENKTETRATARDIKAVSRQHQEIIELMADRLTANATLQDILRTAEDASAGVLMKCADSLAQCAAQIARCESELEALARELISDDDEDRSIKTPFGTLKLTKSTALVGPEDGGDEAVISQIEAWATGRLGKRQMDILSEAASVSPIDDFLRTEVGLDREALESLPDEALNVLKLRRVKTVSFSISGKKLTLENAQALIAKARGNVGGEGGAS